MAAATMQAMVCEGAGRPLALRTLPRPEPGPGEVQIAVRACGVCRTDLHLVDGELPDPKVPVIPGHEIVGTVTAHGSRRHRPCRSARGSACRGWAAAAGTAAFARRDARTSAPTRASPAISATAAMPNTAVADARYVFPLPDRYDDVHAAPLLCAGLIGYRAYALAGDAPHARPLRLRRGGASDRAGRARAGAHGVRLHAPRRRAAQAFARKLGVHWAGEQRRARRRHRSTPR